MADYESITYSRQDAFDAQKDLGSGRFDRGKGESAVQKNMSIEWLEEYGNPMFLTERQKLIASVLNEVSEPFVNLELEVAA